MPAADETPGATGRPLLSASELTPLASRMSVGEKTLALPGTGPLPPALPTVRQLGHYRLLRLIGRGGMGAVWEAEDTRLNRHVAVKLALAGASPQVAERFRREATHAARLRHPHIVPVHDVGCDQGQWYLVMDLVRGTTLAEARRDGLISYRRAAAILEAVARAVAYAHSHGVVHRDLKPENIMLELPGGGSGTVSVAGSAQLRAGSPSSGSGGSLPAETVPLVMDFGLAKDLTASSDLSQSGIALGTPSYMPPEQAGGHAGSAGPAADIYSCGAMLYELLTGRPPFTGENAMQVLHQVLRDDPVPPRRIVRSIPRDLETICLACLEKEPARRYPTAVALAEDLRAWQAGEPITARRTSLIAGSVRLLRRHRWRVAMVLLVLAVLTASGALYLEHLQELSSWRVIAEESLQDDSWSSRWRCFKGGFHRAGDALVTTGAAANVLVWKNRLEGPIAIDYDGTVLPGALPGDLSFIWARGVHDHSLTDYLPTGGLDHPIACQFGTMDGAYTSLRVDDVQVAADPRHPVPGRRYHCRIEIVDTHIRMWIDGAEVAQYTDPFPLTGGYACLYGYYSGKSFSHVRISALSLPQKVPATAVGDAFVQHGDWQDAQEAYTAVADTYPGTALAASARYKAGLCAFRAGDLQAADTLWGPLVEAPYPERIAMHRLEALANHCIPEGASDQVDLTDLPALLQGLETRARSRTPEIHMAAAVLWSQCTQRAMRHELRDACVELTRLHDRVFRNDRALNASEAETLRFLGRYQEILDRFPDIRWVCAWAVAGLGRLHECAVNYTDVRAECAHARFMIGDYAGYEALVPNPRFWTEIQIETGHAQEVLARPDITPTQRGYALLALGRIREAQQLTGTDLWVHCRALMFGNWPLTGPYRPFALLARGEFDAITPTVTPYPFYRHWAQDCRLLTRLIADPADAPTQQAVLALPPAPDAFIEGDVQYGTDCLTIRPAMRALLGDASAWTTGERRLTEEWRWIHQQRLRYAVDLASGRIDATTFRHQPNQLGVEPLLALWSAIAAERRGDRTAAATGYAAFLASRRWQRGVEFDPLKEVFARWRLEALGGDRALWSAPSPPDGEAWPGPGAIDPMTLATAPSTTTSLLHP